MVNRVIPFGPGQQDEYLRYSDFPPVAREIMAHIPRDSALKVLREMVGQRLYFRARHAPAKGAAAYLRLAAVIGSKDADALVKAWRGSILEVPNCSRAFRRATARWMRARCDQGAKLDELCLATGYSRRYVYYLMKQTD